MKRLVVLVGLATVLLGATACTNSTGGQATTGGQTTGGPTSGGTPTSSSGAGALPVDHPCSLLSSSDLTSLGVSSPPTAQTEASAYACEMDTAADHIILAIRTNVGLDGFQGAGGQVQQIQVGSHAAKQEIDNTGSCVIGIGVTSSSRVDVTVTGDGTTNPCPTAMNVANLVVTKLP